MTSIIMRQLRLLGINPRVEATVGTFAAVPYIHLQLEARRRLYPHVPLLVHDDGSPVRAEVLHKAFRGAEILYTLALPSGRRMLSLVPSHHNHAIGESIGIRLDVDHVVTFRHEPQQPQPTRPEDSR